MIKAGRFLYIFICFCILIGGGIQGCGKKGDPRPAGVPRPKAISDLRAKIVEAGVILRWSVPDAKSGIHNFKIQRSELPAEGAVCPDCPREYKTIADISTNDPVLTREEENIASYLDRHINTGNIYSYRIIVCDIDGLCSDPSNIDEVKISPDLSQKGSQGNK